MTKFEDFMREIEEEAVAEGPEAVEQLEALRALHCLECFRLAAQDFEHVLELVRNPPPAGPELRAALRRFRATTPREQALFGKDFEIEFAELPPGKSPLDPVDDE